MSDKGNGRVFPRGVRLRRRRMLGLGIGTAMAMPTVWRRAFGGAVPYRLGTLQPLTGVAALGGKTALIGVQMAVDRINNSGGLLGRPIDLIPADSESNPASGRRAVEKLVTEDNIDFHVGGYLSNVCLACGPVWIEHQVVNMIGVCLDTTLTTTHCNRYTFRPYDFAPAQAKAFAPYLVKELGKKWYITYADYAWGQSTRDAYAREIASNGGEVAGTTGIPLGTPDMTPFLSKINGDFDGLFYIFFGGDAINVVNQSYDLGLARKYKRAGDGAVTVASQLPAMGKKIEDFVAIDRYVPVFDQPLDTPYLHRFFDEAVVRLKKAGIANALPDRYVQSNFEAVNALKLGVEKSNFQGRADTDKLIAALEGMHMKEGDDFPTGDKILRKEDHQAFMREIIFRMEDSRYHLLTTVPWQDTVVPPACTFSA